jgi:hypothetical protein
MPELIGCRLGYVFNVSRRRSQQLRTTQRLPEPKADCGAARPRMARAIRRFDAEWTRPTGLSLRRG